MALPNILRSIHAGAIGLGPKNELIVNKQNSGGTTNAQAMAENVVLLTLTNTQIKALHTTPITLVAAPGAGKAIIGTRLFVHKPASTAYAGSGHLRLRLSGGDSIMSKSFFTSFRGSTDEQFFYQNPPGSDVFNNIGGTNLAANEAVEVDTDAALTGGSTAAVFNVRFHYIVVDEAFMT